MILGHSVSPDEASCHKMKTIREEPAGKAVIRLVQIDKEVRGVLIRDGKTEIFTGDDEAEIWSRLKSAAAASSPNFFGFDDAKKRFLEIFPGGFKDPSYLENERKSKDDAKVYLNKFAPLESARSASGLGEPVLAAFRMTNLLHPTFEKGRVQNALRGPDADKFIRGAAKFADGDIGQGLAEMAHALKPHGVAKWTAATYLPFFWRPEAHMFLKPEATRDFAERVGHRFAEEYKAALEPATYASLIDLVEQTWKEIADLKPADRIDVQSFIWVVGRYDAKDRAAMKSLQADMEE